MGLNGVTDIVSTVMVPKPEYENLVRDAERLQMVSDYVAKCMEGKYQLVDKDVLCLMLDIKCEERTESECDGKQEDI